MKYFAHRGESLIHRDNSIKSIGSALNGKYSGIEFDVQLSRDNVIVLYHDLYIGDSFINELYYKDLIEFDIISIDKLYETLDLSSIDILIDIKGTNMKIVELLQEFYTRHNYSRVIFCSFNRNIVRKINRCFNRGVIFETIFDETEYETIISGFDAIVVHWTCLSDSLIKYCRNNSIKTFTYTHKEYMEFEYMKKFDVDFIITNGLV